VTLRSSTRFTIVGPKLNESSRLALRRPLLEPPPPRVKGRQPQAPLLAKRRNGHVTRRLLSNQLLPLRT
jgi:hypothetical protein